MSKHRVPKRTPKQKFHFDRNYQGLGTLTRMEGLTRYTLANTPLTSFERADLEAVVEILGCVIREYDINTKKLKSMI